MKDVETREILYDFHVHFEMKENIAGHALPYVTHEVRRYTGCVGE